MLALESLVGLHRKFNFSFISITDWGIDLEYCDIEWFALETNRDHCVIFEVVPSTAFQTLYDYESYSISSKVFLSMVVDIIVISAKFAHSSPF